MPPHETANKHDALGTPLDAALSGVPPPAARRPPHVAPTHRGHSTLLAPVN